MTTTAVAQHVPRAIIRDRFYMWMAVACLAVAVVGFTPTYWLPVANGSVNVSPITHVHGLLFSAWLLFFVAQAMLIATGRTAYHRELGIAGVSIATAMLFVGLAVAIHRVRELDGAGAGEMARRFAIVPITGIVFFALMFAAAIRKRAQAAVHKRLMLVATVSLLQAPVARWVRLLLAPPSADPVVGSLPLPPPVSFTILPGLLSDLLLVAAMIHDRRTSGRVHPVFWVAGTALVALQLLRVPVSATDTWMRVINGLLALAP